MLWRSPEELQSHSALRTSIAANSENGLSGLDWKAPEKWGQKSEQSQNLSDPTEIPPYRETGVAIPLSHCVLPVVSQTIAATSPLLSPKMAYRNPKTDLTRGVSQRKLASEAYRAIGGVARNSVANRSIVGHYGQNSQRRGVIFGALLNNT